MSAESKQRLFVNLLGAACFFQMAVLAPVIPRFASEALELDVGPTGVVLAARNLVPILFAASLGTWAVRIGLRRFMLAANWLTALSGVLYFFAHDVYSLTLAQVLGGTFHLAVWVGAQTYTTAMPDRDRVVGVFSMYTALGMAFAPVTGGFALDHGGYDAAFAVYIGASLVQAVLIHGLKEWRAAPVAATTEAGPADSARRAQRAARGSSAIAILSRTGVQSAFLFSFICLFAINARTSFLPVYMEELGRSASVTGILMSIGSLGQAVLRPVTKDAIRLFGLTGVLVGASLLGVIGFFVLPLTTSNIVIGVLMLLHGAGAGLQQSVGLLMIADHTSPDERGFAVGLRATANQVSATAAPAVLGGLAQLLGFGGGFAVTGGLMLALTVLLGRLTRRLQAAET